MINDHCHTRSYQNPWHYPYKSHTSLKTFTLRTMLSLNTGRPRYADPISTAMLQVLSSEYCSTSVSYEYCGFCGNYHVLIELLCSQPSNSSQDMFYLWKICVPRDFPRVREPAHMIHTAAPSPKQYRVVASTGCAQHAFSPTKNVA